MQENDWNVIGVADGGHVGVAADAAQAAQAALVDDVDVIVANGAELNYKQEQILLYINI